jgi:ribosomal protein S18 acetylase RimI-like enzyme
MTFIVKAEANDLHAVIDFLQKRAKATNFQVRTFWDNINEIVEAYHAEELIVAMASPLSSVTKTSKTRKRKRSTEYKLAGFACFDRKAATIRIIEVLPKFQRRGIGTQLVRHMEAEFQQLHTTIFIPVVLYEAQAFWKAMGFRPKTIGSKMWVKTMTRPPQTSASAKRRKIEKEEEKS